MKKTLVILAVFCAACLINPPKAEAINKEWSAVAGFVGGLLVADAFSHDTVVYRDYGYRGYDHRVDLTPRGYRSGYWKTVCDRRWVSGYRSYYYDHCGRQRYNWVPGHWETYNRQVWVSHCD